MCVHTHAKTVQHTVGTKIPCNVVQCSNVVIYLEPFHSVPTRSVLVLNDRKPLHVFVTLILQSTFEKEEETPGVVEAEGLFCLLDNQIRAFVTRKLFRL